MDVDASDSSISARIIRNFSLFALKLLVLRINNPSTRIDTKRIVTKAIKIRDRSSSGSRRGRTLLRPERHSTNWRIRSIAPSVRLSLPEPSQPSCGRKKLYRTSRRVEPGAARKKQGRRTPKSLDGREGTRDDPPAARQPRHSRRISRVAFRSRSSRIVICGIVARNEIFKHVEFQAWHGL